MYYFLLNKMFKHFHAKLNPCVIIVGAIALPTAAYALLSKITYIVYFYFNM